MRKTLLYVGSVVILVLAAITFIFIPGMSESFARGGLPPFGKYDGKNIEYAPGTDFANAVSNYAENLRKQGQELNEMVYYYIYANAFRQVVFSRAFVGAVEKAGFGPGDKTVNRMLSMYYVDEKGNFSKRMYNSVSESDRKALRSQIVQNLKYGLFQEDHFGYKIGDIDYGGIKSSEKETEFFKNMAAKTKSFDLVGFDVSMYPEEKILEYANANADLFRRYDLSVITMSSESKLKGIVNQINSSELTFADAMNTYSEKYYSDSEGKVNDSYKHRVLNILENSADADKVFSGKIDELSPIVKTKYGYSVFRMDREPIDANFNDFQVLGDVKLYITSNEAGLVDEYFINSGKEFAASAATGSFDAACKKFNLTKRTLSDFQINYGNIDMFTTIPFGEIPELSDAATNEEFLKIASSLKKNEVSEPIKVGKYIVVLKATGEKTKEADSGDSKPETAIASSLNSYDSSSAESRIINSPKVVDNVQDVYFKYFSGNN